MLPAHSLSSGTLLKMNHLQQYLYICGPFTPKKIRVVTFSDGRRNQEPEVMIALAIAFRLVLAFVREFWIYTLRLMRQVADGSTIRCIGESADVSEA